MCEPGFLLLSSFFLSFSLSSRFPLHVRRQRITRDRTKRKALQFINLSLSSHTNKTRTFFDDKISFFFKEHAAERKKKNNRGQIKSPLKRFVYILELVQAGKARNAYVVGNTGVADKKKMARKKDGGKGSVFVFWGKGQKPAFIVQ